MATTRAYHYTFEGPTSCEVRFWDPTGEDHDKLFHSIEVAAWASDCMQTASAEHLCVNDLYKVELTLDAARAAWRTVWHVKGPEKDFTIFTAYSTPRAAPLDALSHL